MLLLPLTFTRDAGTCPTISGRKGEAIRSASGGSFDGSVADSISSGGICGGRSGEKTAPPIS